MPSDPDRIDPSIGDLRGHTARGTMINSAYQVGIAAIGLSSVWRWRNS
jgi:hypothetical protein